MPENKGNKDVDTIAACSENLTIIKELLFEAKTKTMYARWAFFVWGPLVALGGFIHFLVAGIYNLGPGQYFLYIWVPILVVAGFLELISFIQNLSKQSLSIFSRPIVKFYLGLFILCFMIIFTTLVLISHENYQFIPLFLTFSAAGFFVLYAMMTHINYFIPAAFLSALASILFLFSLPSRLLVLICSFGVGLSWIMSGILCYFLEKKE